VDSYVRELLTSAPGAIAGAKRLIAAVAEKRPARWTSSFDKPPPSAEAPAGEPADKP
jgi:hypothetical protein